MPPIEAIVRPRRNRISVTIPSEYGSNPFHVILVPLGPDCAFPKLSSRRRQSEKRSFVDALLACPRLDEGETLDVSRDESDFGMA